MTKEKDKIIDLLNKTKSVIVFHNEAKEELIEEGILKQKISVIRQSLNTIKELDISESKTIDKFNNSNYIIFLFPAGIRKVKAPLEMIEMMSKLVEKLEHIKLIIVGPILDLDLGDQLKEKIKDKEWVEYLGEVSHQRVQNLISKSDIMLNNSISEGMSSTLLEAQQMGKPILATDISGNRAIVNHGVDGFLFKNYDEFEYYATKLIKEKDLRIEMGREALKSISNYSLKEEINLYENVYRK